MPFQLTKKRENQQKNKKESKVPNKLHYKSNNTTSCLLYFCNSTDVFCSVLACQGSFFFTFSFHKKNKNNKTNTNEMPYNQTAVCHFSFSF